MILTLLIKVVEETKQGVSRSTGNAWQSRCAVLEAQDGEGVFRVYAKMYGEMVTRFEELGLGVGQVATFDLQFSTDEYRGFVSNKVNIVSIHNSQFIIHNSQLVMTNSEILEFQLGKIEGKLMEKAATQQKKQGVEKLMQDLRYCVEHMDEGEYGIVFVRNIAIAAGVAEGEYTSLGNAIVRNTQRVMIGRVKAVLNGHREADPDCTNRNETLLPGSRWAYLGYSCYVRRCKHDVTVHFKCGKRGSVPTYDEVSGKLKGLIEEAEKLG